MNASEPFKRDAFGSAAAGARLPVAMHVDDPLSPEGVNVDLPPIDLAGLDRVALLEISRGVA